MTGDPINPLPFSEFVKVDFAPYLYKIRGFAHELAEKTDLARRARLNFIGSEVLAEIERARRKHGAQSGIPDGTGGTYWQAAAEGAKRVTDMHAEAGAVSRLDIVREEVFEAFAESDLKNLREELIQSAAMIQAWIYDIDTR